MVTGRDEPERVNSDTDKESQVDEQARQQTGQAQIRLRINESNLTTSYSNAFRTNTSAEEVIVDFGMNLLVPNPQGQQQPSGNSSQAVGEIQFQANNRVVMNYYTAKRLAVVLGQVVRQHEERFGELKLNASERVKK